MKDNADLLRRVEDASEKVRLLRERKGALERQVRELERRRVMLTADFKRLRGGYIGPKKG